MINVHLNGDIVRCPDISSIYARNSQLRETKKLCKYGYSESECMAWRKKQQEALNNANWDDKKNLYKGRCLLGGSIDCPGHLLRTKNGIKEKTFEINNQVYRKVASTAHYLTKESNCKTIFITLTFPPFQKKHKLTKKIFEDEILNSYFSKFVENLTKNYHCAGYIAVRERGEVGNRVHYHLLMSIPFTSFSVLNDSWCNCIKNICVYSDHALQTRRKKVILFNPAQALRYICKYVSKSKGQKSDCRVVFISNKLLSHKKIVPEGMSKVKGLKFKTRELNYVKNMRLDTETVLDNYKFDYMRRTSDYTTSFRITDYKEFSRFCEEFLYPFFELSAKKSKFFTSDYIKSG
jgi:hypothetical protein